MTTETSADTIDIFIATRYTEERKELFYRTIGLMTVFNYLDPIADIVDTIAGEGQADPAAIADRVGYIFETTIDNILNANHVKVLNEVSYRDRINIAEGIFAFTKIENAEEYLPLFDGWLNNEDIFAKTLGLVLDQPWEDIRVHLSWVYDGTIARLKEYLQSVQVENDTVEFSLIREIRTNILAFYKAFGSIDSVLKLQEINVLKGQPFDSYMNMFREDFIDQNGFDASGIEESVYCLLFFAIISEEGHKNPNLLLMDKVKGIYADYKHQTLFNSMLTKALSVYLPIRDHEV